MPGGLRERPESNRLPTTSIDSEARQRDPETSNSSTLMADIESTLSWYRSVAPNLVPPSINSTNITRRIESARRRERFAQEEQQLLGSETAGHSSGDTGAGGSGELQRLLACYLYGHQMGVKVMMETMIGEADEQLKLYQEQLLRQQEAAASQAFAGAPGPTVETPTAPAEQTASVQDSSNSLLVSRPVEPSGNEVGVKGAGSISRSAFVPAAAVHKEVAGTISNPVAEIRGVGIRPQGNPRVSEPPLWRLLALDNISRAVYPGGVVNPQSTAADIWQHGFHGRTILTGCQVEARKIPKTPLADEHPIKPSGKPEYRPVDPRLTQERVEVSSPAQDRQ